VSTATLSKEEAISKLKGLLEANEKDANRVQYTYKSVGSKMKALTDLRMEKEFIEHELEILGWVDDRIEKSEKLGTIIKPKDDGGEAGGGDDTHKEPVLV